MALVHLSSYFHLSFIFLPPHAASCVHCMRAPVSGPPVLWARWPRLLWETLWHGEGIRGRPAVDYLHRVWLLPAWLEPPNLHTRVTLIYKFQQQLSVRHFGPERDLRSRLAIFFAVMPDYIFNPVTWNKFLIQHLYCTLFWNSLRKTVLPEVIIKKILLTVFYLQKMWVKRHKV